MHCKFKLILFFLSVSISSVSLACVKTNLNQDKIKELNSTITDSSKECTIIANSPINTNVVDLINETIGMLRVLQDNSSFGDISWLNAMSIDAAIETLSKFLLKPEELNVKTIVGYDLKMRKYFETYIIDDLNDQGLKMYNFFVERQKSIIDQTMMYADNLINYNKLQPKQNLR
jgi:predicted S18 family serine protease